MGFSTLRRRLLLGAVAVTLTAGMVSNTFADEGLLKKVKDRGTLIVGNRKGLTLRSVSRVKTAN